MTIPLFNFQGWTLRKAPADPEKVVALSAASRIELPDAYLNLLLRSNGGEGPLGVEPGWFQIWPAEDVLIANRKYEIQEFLPGLFGFGSNGGGELLAFDTRKLPPWPVVMVPFIGMEDDTIIIVAKDFEGFLREAGRASSDF